MTRRRLGDAVASPVAPVFASATGQPLLTLAGVLVWRYFRRGGALAMLRMMNKPMGDHHGEPDHGHAHG
jgi:hypothetical protein